MSADDGERHRLHPANVLVDIGKNGWRSLAGMAGLFAATSQGDLAWILTGLLFGLVAGVGLPALRWWRFTYQFLPNELVIEQGVLNRRRRSIPFERIQDVSISQSPFARLFSLVRVTIDTGGGKGEEGTLDGLPVADARRLRETLLHAAPAATDSGGDEAPPPPVFAMGLGRVLLHGVLSFSPLFWLAALGGGLNKLRDWTGFGWRELVAFGEREGVERLSVGAIAAAALLVVAIAVAISVVRTLFRDFGFRLSHAQGRFRVVRGLLWRNEVAIADRRIQAALIKRGAIAGAFGWRSVDFQALGGGGDARSGRYEVAPMARAGEAEHVVAAAGMPQFAADRLSFVAKAHGTRLAIRRALIWAAWLAPVIWLSPRAGWALLVLIPVAATALLSPRFHRFALADGALHVGRGVLTRREWIVPLGSVQAVTLRRGPLQRMLGLMTVSPDTAGARERHRPVTEDIAPQRAVALAGALLGLSLPESMPEPAAPSAV